MNFRIICNDRNNYEIPYTTKIFAGGEVHVKLGKIPRGFGDHQMELVTVKGFIKNSDMLMELAQVVNALIELSCLDNQPYIRVDLGYLPYARQDRVCNTGESFSLRLFTIMLSAIEADEFIFDNLHSDVSRRLLKSKYGSFGRWKERTLTDLVSPYLQDKDVVLVSPDKGALPKSVALSVSTGKHLCTYNKVRNTETGAIEKTEFVESGIDVAGKTCLIVDDILDGGRTFVPIIKDLLDRGAKYVYLYATHVILPYGPDALIEAGVADIFYTNLLNEDVKDHNDIWPIDKF